MLKRVRICIDLPEIIFDVIDYTNPLLHWRDTRRLVFQHGSTYAYSSPLLHIPNDQSHVAHLDGKLQTAPIASLLEHVFDMHFNRRLLQAKLFRDFCIGRT